MDEGGEAPYMEIVTAGQTICAISEMPARGDIA